MHAQVRQLPMELRAAGALIRSLARERSLLRVVSRQRNSLAITPKWVRRRCGATDFLTRLLHDELAFFWVLPLAIGVAFIGWNVHFGRSQAPREGRHFSLRSWAFKL